jgi:hypothetical protein
LRTILGVQMREQKLQDLLTEMAKNLDFGVDRYDVARIYAPKWLTEEDQLRFLDRQRRLQAFRSAQETAKSPSLAPAPASADLSTQVPSGTYLLKSRFQDNTSVAVLAIGNGSIAGTDITVTYYLGSYKIAANRFVGSITLQIPPGTTLVTGQIIEMYSDASISFDLPLHFRREPSNNRNAWNTGRGYDREGPPG